MQRRKTLNRSAGSAEAGVGDFTRRSMKGRASGLSEE